MRKHFPDFAEKSEWKLELPTGIEAQIPSDVFRQVAQASGNKNYEFSSMDNRWKINLTRTFVALSTREYERWEVFKEKLTIPFDALVEVYSPDFFTRIGLRYVDVIRRSNLGLSDVAWNRLLPPYVSGLLSSPQAKARVKNFENRYEIQLADGQSIVRMITKFIKAGQDGEICFVIDSDFYDTGKTNAQDAMKRLDYFNSRASRLIRWCITDRLHEAMEPQPV